MARVKGPYALTFTTGASVTSAILLNDVFDQLNLAVPSTSGAIGANEKIYVESSCDNVTFSRHTAYESQTAVVGGTDLSIKSGLSSRLVPLPYQGCEYVRLAMSAGVTSSAQCVFQVFGLKNNL